MHDATCKCIWLSWLNVFLIRHILSVLMLAFLAKWMLFGNWMSLPKMHWFRKLNVSRTCVVMHMGFMHTHSFSFITLTDVQILFSESSVCHFAQWNSSIVSTNWTPQAGRVYMFFCLNTMFISKYLVLHQLNLLWTLQLEALYPNVYKSVHEYGNRYCKGVRNNGFYNQKLVTYSDIVVVLFESLRNIITFRELLDYIKAQVTMKNYTIWWKQPWWSAGSKRKFFLNSL